MFEEQERLLEVCTLDPFHFDDRSASELPKGGDVHDVWVPELRQKKRLVSHPADDLCVVQVLLLQHLQRDGPSRGLLGRDTDRAKRT